MTDQVHAADGGPVTPKVRRSSGTSVVTNPYRGDQGRYLAAPYVTYAETGQKSQNSSVEEIDNSCVVYVGGLTNMTDDRILYDTFRQFGSIVSLVRRSVNFDVRPNSTMTQYAFIGFSNAQDAQNAIQTGEITLDNRKLIIKPRDKPGVSYHKHISHGLHNPRAYGGFKEKHGDEGRDQIFQLLQKNNSGVQPTPQSPTTYEGQQQQHIQQAQQQPREHRVQQKIQHEQQMPAQSPPANREPISYYDGRSSGPAGTKTNNPGQSPVLMSKALNVANVPIDMSPKELFTMFSEVGLVEGCYIFPFADMMNRRFGHIVMSTFYCAQKACENYDGYTIRGCTLDVTYRSHTESDTNPTSSPITPYNAIYQPMQQPFSPPFQQQFQQANFPTPMYHPAFQAQHQQMTWVPQPYGSTPPSIVSPAGMIPFAHQFPQYQNMIPFAAYNPMGPMSPLGFEAQHHNSASPADSPPYRNFPTPNLGWQGQVQVPVPGKSYPTGRPYVPRRQSGRNGRHFLSNRPPTHFPGGEPHLRSVSDSSSTTLVSSGYDQTKFDGPVIINGSYTSSPIIVNGSYAGSCETPSRNSINDDTSESDKDSTPSPTAIRSAPDPKLIPETPTKVSSRATFEVLTASIIPETTEPADPANLYIKNLDDTVISDVEDLKLLFVPYGPVASSFLSTYPGSGISRGYGFVAFVKQEDAAAAKTKLNGTMVGKKRVFISYAERKEDRTQRLKGLFGGEKGDSKKEKKEDGKATDEINEDSSNGGILENVNANEHVVNDKKVVIVESTTDDQLSKEISVVDIIDSAKSTAKLHDKETAEPPENDITPIVAEQGIIASTTRWRGTQLTGIAEVVEEEDLSRTNAVQDSPSLSANSAYVSPCIVHSPTYTPRGSPDNLHVSQAVSVQPIILEQLNSQVPSPKEPPLDISINGNYQNASHISFARQGEEPHPQRYANHSPNRFSGDQGDTRGSYGPRQSQGYYQNNGVGNSGIRPFYRSNNNTGNCGSTKSMLPVPRNPNGNIQMAPAFMAPNSQRMPYFNNAAQQPFYPSFPNNEPIGQNYQGRKSSRKNSGRGRARDNSFSTHQARTQNPQMNGGIAGKIEMTATAF